MNIYCKNYLIIISPSRVCSLLICENKNLLNICQNMCKNMLEHVSKGVKTFHMSLFLTHAYLNTPSHPVFLIHSLLHTLSHTFSHSHLSLTPSHDLYHLNTFLYTIPHPDFLKLTFSNSLSQTHFLKLTFLQALFSLSLSLLHTLFHSHSFLHFLTHKHIHSLFLAHPKNYKTLAPGAEFITLYFLCYLKMDPTS